MTVTKEMIEAGVAEIRKVRKTPVWDRWTDHDAIEAVILAALSYRSAEAGKPVVKALEWDYEPCTASNNWRAVTPFGAYGIFGTLGENGRVWCSVGQSELNGKAGLVEDLQALCDADYEARILSALSTPSDIEPVAWIAKSRWEQMTAAEPWLTNTVYSEDQSRSFPCVALYAAPVADREPVSVPEVVEAAGFVKAAIVSLEGYEKDCGEPLPDDHELGRIEDSRHSASFRIRVGHIRRLASAIAAAPQPNPSTVDAEGRGNG